MIVAIARQVMGALCNGKASMFVNVSILHIAAGKARDFEAMSAEANEAILKAPGFIGRQLLRDETHPGRYFYTSTWRHKADIEAYRATEAVSAQKAALGGAQLMDGPIDQSDCAVVLQELSPSAG